MSRCVVVCVAEPCTRVRTRGRWSRARTLTCPHRRRRSDVMQRAPKVLEDRGTTKLELGYCSTLAWADGIDAESQLLIQKMMAEDTMSGPAGRYSLRVKKGKKDGSEEKEDDAVRV